MALCIPDIRVNGCRPREIVILQGHWILAHLGSAKTTEYVRRQTWWSGMRKDIAAFCTTCVTCDTSKIAYTEANWTTQDVASSLKTVADHRH